MEKIGSIIKRLAIFGLTALLILVPLDYLHIIFGVRTKGAHSWTTPLAFGILGLLLGGLSFKLDPKPQPNKILSVLFHGILFIIGYLFTAIWGSFPICNIILCFSLGLLIVCHLIFSAVMEVSLKEVLPFILLLGIAGPIFELLDVRLGGFQYIAVGPGLIPYWLPLLWGSGAWFVRSLIGLKE